MVRLVITVVPACWESRIKICSTGGGLRKTQRVETRESSYQNDSALQEKGESYDVLPRRNAKITGVRARTLGLMSEISKQSHIASSQGPERSRLGTYGSTGITPYSVR